ncbi:alcohol dehydrogenase catalytic domain-containing protein [Ruania halotolerans]|uniref:alcohol dehydrogenase catalytic domain-containing protein n=1 Tax=Ruania halotolerans TaxID=2897773 RepID=UPI001E2A4163|nr:alcohol dehydrogenase catalytic domain-containing protein [Ruania halotolerans]UFU07906.1 alcohol dehydrogenase catalytic domain-containing protein [Ruania halotolerans]
MPTATVPPTMRASLLIAPEQLEIREIATPEPRPGDVLVRIEQVGLCGSDVHFFTHGRVGSLVVAEPLILGHEAAGVIAAVGAGVPEQRLGERVAIEPQRHCRECSYCLDGRYNLCESMEFASAPPVHGAFAEYMSVPAMFAHPIPDVMTFEQAALAEPLSVGLAAVRKVPVTENRVLVAGGGPIGVLTAAAARAHGAREVVLTDPIATRRAHARALGATTAVGPDQLGDHIGGGFEVFVDTSGVPAAIDAGLQALRPGGNAVMVGMGHDRIDLDLFRVQSYELHLHGLFRYVRTWPTAIDLIDRGVVTVDPLISDRTDLGGLPQAMRRNGDPEVMKILINPQQ